MTSLTILNSVEYLGSEMLHESKLLVNVYIGKNLDKEIDFVATLRDEKLYVQVCRELPKESDRELANLMEINDNYPKMVVTLDDYANGNYNGIKIVNIVDFLLNKNI